MYVIEIRMWILARFEIAERRAALSNCRFTWLPLGTSALKHGRDRVDRRRNGSVIATPRGEE